MKGLGFFLGLEKYMNSRLVLATIWEGPNVVKTEPAKPGDTNPAESKPGTLRGDFCFQVGRTIIHGGDSVKKMLKEKSAYALSLKTWSLQVLCF